MTCGYRNSAGTDLDSLFLVNDSNAGAIGFKIAGGGDLGNRFATGSLGYAVGYKNSAGTDIGYLRGKDIIETVTVNIKRYTQDLGGDSGDTRYTYKPTTNPTVFGVKTDYFCSSNDNGGVGLSYYLRIEWSSYIEHQGKTLTVTRTDTGESVSGKLYGTSKYTVFTYGSATNNGGFFNINDVGKNVTCTLKITS